MRLQTSPFSTRQEEYRDDPFKMLMVCFMLNQTHHRQVDAVRHQFFARFGSAESLLSADDQEVVDLIRPLGFYNKRTKLWKQFCSQWLAAEQKYGSPLYIPATEVERMKGVGKYALDSWKIFQLFDYSVEPDDHVLNRYIVWAREEKKRILREQGTHKPYSVYYAHYKDDRGSIPNYSRLKDYVCCVSARTTEEAIEKTIEIAMNQPGSKHVKILGVAPAKQEWVNESRWKSTNPELYRRLAQEKKTAIAE
jgi:hypothetical protein